MDYSYPSQMGKSICQFKGLWLSLFIYLLLLKVYLFIIIVFFPFISFGFSASGLGLYCCKNPYLHEQIKSSKVRINGLMYLFITLKVAMHAAIFSACLLLLYYYFPKRNNICNFLCYLGQLASTISVF